MIENDLDALVEAIRSVSNAEPSDLSRKGQAGRALGRSKFTLESVAARLAELYASLCANA